MSVSQAAVLFDSRSAAASAVETRARDLGYDVTFLEPIDLRGRNQAVRVLFEGTETGFESSFETLDDFDWMPEELGSAGDRLLVIITPGGDFTAGLFANVFLRAFCDVTDAGWWYMDVGTFQTPGTTNDYFDEQVADYRAYIARQPAPAPPPSPTPPKRPTFLDRLLSGFR